MGKLIAVVLVIIALASAYPIITHMYVMPEDISTHGHQIDEQLSDTMAEAGISFLLAQFVLAFFVWTFAERKVGVKLKNFPGGAGMFRRAVRAAVTVVARTILRAGSREIKVTAVERLHEENGFGCAR